MIHDPVEQGHDKYNSLLSSSSFNLGQQTQVVVPKYYCSDFVIVLSGSIGFTYCYYKLE